MAGYRLDTNIAGPIIEQHVLYDPGDLPLDLRQYIGPEIDLPRTILRRVMNTADQQVHDALVAMGWTPPPTDEEED